MLLCCLITAWRGETFWVLIGRSERTRCEGEHKTDKVNYLEYARWISSFSSLFNRKIIEVKIIDDEEYEKNKAFTIELGEPVLLEIGQKHGGCPWVCLCVWGCSERKSRSRERKERVTGRMESLFNQSLRPPAHLSLINKVRPALIVWNLQSKLRLTRETFHFERGKDLKNTGEVFLK